MKHLVVFGTRPEAIKMAPVVKMLQKKGRLKVCITAQHREMLDQVLDFFEITPDYDLNLMQPGQNLHDLTARIITSLKPVLDDCRPEMTWVHGDTTTSMAAAMAAFYAGSSVAHIEAGLRTHNMKEPFPEELNRNLTSKLADYHFTPTQQAAQNLIDENQKESSIIHTGNTVIDALFYSIDKIKNGYSDPELERVEQQIDETKKVVLVTAHRRENHGAGFEGICRGLKKLAERNPDLQLIYPVHLNPNVQKPVKKHLQDCENIVLLEPLNYPAFVNLIARSHFVITDSGGIQEEAPGLGKPVLVMRDVTERPEAVKAGTVKLVGTDADKILSEAEKILTDDAHRSKMSQTHNPYGDGQACERISEFLEKQNLS